MWLRRAGAVLLLRLRRLRLRVDARVLRLVEGRQLRLR
jgi:hypothetical protein